MNVKELVAKYRKQLAEVGGMDNEMVSIPAGGVRKMLDEFEAAADDMENRLPEMTLDEAVKVIVGEEQT